MRPTLMFVCAVSLGVAVAAPARQVFAQAGVCRSGDCPCSAATESNLEHVVLNEIKSRREIWDAAEEFLHEGKKEAEEAGFSVIGEVTTGATVHTLLHGLLHAIASGAATPVAIAEVVEIAFGVGESTADAWRALADARKKHDRALSDAAGLDKKIQRDLDALDKCRAANKGRAGTGRGGGARFVAVSYVVGQATLDPVSVRAQLAEGARIIAAARDYGDVNGIPGKADFRRASASFSSASAILRQVRGNQPAAAPSDAGARLRAAAATSDRNRDLTAADRASALRAAPPGPALVKAFDGFRAAYTSLKLQVQHDERVLKLLRARTR
jgi:hypothetical protein